MRCRSEGWESDHFLQQGDRVGVDTGVVYQTIGWSSPSTLRSDVEKSWRFVEPLENFPSIRWSRVWFVQLVISNTQLTWDWSHETVKVRGNHCIRSSFLPLSQDREISDRAEVWRLWRLCAMFLSDACFAMCRRALMESVFAYLLAGQLKSGVSALPFLHIPLRKETCL